RKTRSLAEEEYQKIEVLPTEAKKARLLELKKENPEVLKKVLDLLEDKKAGLTPQESQLKEATVKVRAQYIRAKLEQMSSSEEKKAF
ncbi:hypothetical protein QU894_29415, partial [Citrobacter freundii]|uniref:hypothetical protein n=1 Tax=Citrobacter freundii TaxID=546 RepID=UPI0038B73535